jgi:3-hydroxyisobutyrate dehydrogenase
MAMRVGFIGLGLMGMPMARNILKAGFPLSLYSRSSDKTKELVSEGAVVATSPSALGQSCDVVISMVTGPTDVEEVFLGKDGVATSPKEGLIVIDMSTIGPMSAKDIASKLQQKGVAFIDAPVTGSTPRAKTGELTIFIGGERDVIEKIRPVLLAMGTTLHHMGPVGMGQAIKMINNYFVAVEAVAMSEGMMLADQMGLDRLKAAEVLQSACTGMSPIMQLVIKNYATHEHPLLFSLGNMRKDITLAQQEARDKHFSLMNLTQKIFDEGVTSGLAHEDFSSIIKLLERKDR